MDFSLTSVFVNPVGQALATTGSTQNLTAGQMAFYKKGGVIATTSDTTANVQLVQGRNAGEYTDISKKSDFFGNANVVEYKKIAAVNTNQQQIITISNFIINCDDQVAVTLKAFSRYLGVGYPNGKTRTFISNAPCCDCDDLPCATVDATAYQNIVDDLVAKINASDYFEFLVASRGSSAGTSTLILTGKAPVVRTNIGANPYNYDFQFDMVRFAAFVTKQAPTNAELIDMARCTPTATVTRTQEATYLHGSSKEVADIERDHYSYQTAGFKDIFTNGTWNVAYTSNVTAGTFYDEYRVRFRTLAPHSAFVEGVAIDETVRVFFPTGSAQGTAFETLMAAIVGAYPLDKEA